MATQADEQIFAVSTKAPGENLALTVDFSNVLGAGEQIASGTISDPSPFAQVGSADPASIDGGTNNGLTFRLSGGALGDTVDITVTATTDATPTANVFVRVLRVVAGFKSDIDRVRFLVGDQDPNDELAGDDEYVWALCENANSVYHAGAVIARGIAGKFARRTNWQGDDVSLDAGQMFDHYNKLASELQAIAETRTGSGTGASSVPGALVSGVDAGVVRDVRNDTNRVQSRVTPRLDDNPGARAGSGDETGF